MATATNDDDELERDMTIDLLSQKPKKLTVKDESPTVGPEGAPLGVGMAPAVPYEQGGVTGNTAPLDRGQPATSYNMRGFEQSKLAADPSQQSEKYKIGNIMKKYDPKGGVTPEMLAELNALGIAEFSGSGGDLTVKNTKNDPRFGSGGTGDVVYAYDAQNGDTAWQPWFIDDGAGQAGAGAPQGQSMMSAGDGGGSAFDSLAPMDNDFFRRLQEKAQQLLGGAGAMDRDALLKMLEAK